MDKVTAGNESSITERRHNARLRSIFPDARTRVAHFFQRRVSFLGWMDHR
jgi:hypothetical protein